MIAVDVGYGQLVWSLQTDERVTVMDRTNVRTLTLDDIGGEPVDLVVSDLSFISLTLVLPALIGVVKPDGDLVLMVKPQFEVGKERLGKGGVGPRPGAARGRRPRSGGQGAASSAGESQASRPARCLVRQEMSNTSCGYADQRPPLDETMLQTAIESGPQ